ncbi:MAG: hypothetical protein ACI906_000521 [Candidatus Latescibacterota bacterium]
MIVPWIGAAILLLGLWSSTSLAQVETYLVGRGGLSWADQAQEQTGAVENNGSLQPLELISDQNLIQLLRNSGLSWLNGQPDDFTAVGQPRAWSNDGLFDQLDGPLRLIDGDENSSSEGVFKTIRSQAGTTFFWDLGAPFPINRVRFFPDPDDIDSFIKAFELRVNDGEDYNEGNRPLYQLLRRVEGNRDPVVDLVFPPLQGRFLQLKVLSKSAFNLAEFEIFGEGFVPVSSYVSELHSFGGAVNFGLLRIATTKLTRGGDEGKRPIVTIQMRSGADDTPLSYFRRDRDTGSVDEVSFAEYNADLPRRALFRQDPNTGEALEELSREDYINLPSEEQGPVRDFVKGDIRGDGDNWSPWSTPLVLDATGTMALPIDLPSPREFFQFKISFNGDAEATMRIDTLSVEIAPALVSTAAGEVALSADLDPVGGVLVATGGVDTSFVYDIRTEFADAGLAGFRGIKLAAFPPPVFTGLKMGDPLVEVTEVEVVETADGFHVFFEPVNEANNQPLRVAFRLRPLEHNTPVSAWLLGTEAVPPHPISVGNASAEVGTEKINIFTLDIKPTVEVQISTPVITPNGDGINETAEIAFVLTQFAADLEVEIDIFDLSGHQVRKIIAGARTAGAYREAWDGRGNGGTMVPPGTYICRLAVKADAKSIETTKLIGVAY